MRRRDDDDVLCPPEAPYTTGSISAGSMTTGVRTRASKMFTAGLMPRTWIATQGAPHPAMVKDGVAMQPTSPHPATHAAIARAQMHPAAVAARASTKSAISNVQAALASQGHNPGSTNGELDHPTRAALRSFQSANGLPVTGVIDARTHATVLANQAKGTGRRAGQTHGESAGQSTAPTPKAAIQHSAPKGPPVTRIVTSLPPLNPTRRPTAGVAHPAAPRPPHVTNLPPKLPGTTTVTFKNSFGHPGGRAGAPVSVPGPGAAGAVRGTTATNKPAASGAAAPAAPPQGSGAVAGGAHTSLGYLGGSGSGPGGAAAGDTGGRVGGFRPGGSAGRRAQGSTSAPTQTGARTMANKGGTKGWRSTGWRIALVLTASITGSGNAQISVNPQMDFRGENLVIDSTTVGPSSTLTIPSVGTIPQIAGGSASTAVPGTLFSPAQAGALDFKMSIANQGNAIAFTANNTNTSVTLAFAALLFGTEVEMDQTGGMTTGVAPAGSYTGG